MTRERTPLTMNGWAQEIDRWAETKGWNKEREFGDWVSLAHSELSEAYEEYRTGHGQREVYYVVPSYGVDDRAKPEGIPVEMGDVLIRVLHWFARHKINPDEIMALKMAYNEGRPFRHGDKTS